MRSPLLCTPVLSACDQTQQKAAGREHPPLFLLPLRRGGKGNLQEGRFGVPRSINKLAYTVNWPRLPALYQRVKCKVYGVLALSCRTVYHARSLGGCNAAFIREALSVCRHDGGSPTRRVD